MNVPPQNEEAKMFVERYLTARYGMDEIFVREEAKLDEFFSQVSKRRSDAQEYICRRSGEHVVRLEQARVQTYVITSGEGLGEKRYAVVNHAHALKIENIEAVCVCCDGTGRGIEDLTCCTYCGGTGWTDAGS